MKCGPFPPGALCCTPISSTTTRSDCLSTARHFPGSPVIGAHRFPPPTATGPRRLSPVPRTTIRPFNAQYAGGFLGARSRIPGAFRGLRRPYTGSAPPLPAQRRLLDDACSGFTHVADRTVARPRFAPGLSTTHGGFATKDPGVSPGPDSHRQAALNLSLGFTSCRTPSLHGARAVWAHAWKATACAKRLRPLRFAPRGLVARRDDARC
jgi:hypothetical protein